MKPPCTSKQGLYSNPSPSPPGKPQPLLPGDGIEGGVEPAHDLLDGLCRAKAVVCLPGHQAHLWWGGGWDGDELQKVCLRPRALVAQVPLDPPLPLPFLLVLFGLDKLCLLLQAPLIL
jgi:hypothetical protein